MIDPFLAVFLAPLAIGGSVALVRGLWRMKPEHQYDRLYAKFNAETADKSFDEQQQEVALRYAIVRLRRKVSAEVIDNPAGYSASVTQHAADEGMMLAQRDRALGRKFISWAAGAAPSEILYRGAMKALTKWSKAGAPNKRTIQQDDIAAFTTLQ